MNTKMRFATLAAVVVVTMMAFAGEMSAQTVRLEARKNKTINGVETELRGSYREKNAPIRLNVDLENINIPVGKKVAFCLLQNGVKTLIGVGEVSLQGGTRVATVELEANDGDHVPNVNAGDVLQARQRAVAPFIANPGCGTFQLISGIFQ